MKKTRFLTLSLFLAISGFGAAYAQAPALTSGDYKLTVGSKAPCTLAITDTGSITQAADCATGTTLARWKATSTGYVLTSASGEVYAILQPHGAALEGVTFMAQNKVVLTH